MIGGRVASTRSIAIVAIAFVGIAISAGAVFFLFSPRVDPTRELFGVRLGMTAGQVRSRFVFAHAGSWENRAGDPALLLWKAETSGGPLRTARFEIHNGLLVAVGVVVREESAVIPRRKLELSSAAVLSRGPSNGPWVDLRWMSRDCPLHAEEIRRLLRDADLAEQ